MSSGIEPARGGVQAARVRGAGVAAVLLLSLLAAQPALGDAQSAAARRTASKCSLGKAQTQMQMGQVLTLSGKVKPKGARTVKVQMLMNRRWRGVASGRSSRRTGAFRLKVRFMLPGPVKVRAYAPRTRRLAAATCKATTFTVRAPLASPSS